MMQFDLPKEISSIIKVIGVGGGGSNAVNHMYRQGIKGVEFIVCNTDAQALDVSPVPVRIQLGSSLTEGRGAGSLPDVGKNAALENLEEVKKYLSSNTRMVFITAGMGGGTGTGAAPVIAAAAKEMGILTVGIVTVPFSFEGKRRKMQADEGIEQLKKSVDTLLVICNDKLREMYGNLRLAEAFAHADDVLTTAARGIAEIITVTGYVNVDFEDVKTVMTNSGVAIMGSAKAEGENRAIRAVEEAIASPLLNDNQIAGARYILLNIASGTNEVTMDEVSEITDYIQQEAGSTADIIWGNCSDETLGESIAVTIIATGFKTKQEVGAEKKPAEKIILKLEEDKPLEKTYLTEVEETQKNAANPLEPVLVVRDELAKTTPAIAPLDRLSEETKEEEQIQNIMPEASVPSEQAASIQEQESTPEISFEFEIGGANVTSAEEPSLFSEEMTSPEMHTEEKTVPAPMMNEPAVLPAAASQPPAKEKKDDSIDEQLKRSKERILKLKAMNMKLGSSSSGLADLEKVPAYVRKNIQLNATPSSSESEVSRYTLSEDEEKKPEIRPNNSFLHDKVD